MPIDAADQLTDLTSAQKRQLLVRLLRERAGPVRSVPLSFAQERLWFLEQWQPGNGAYHLPVLLSLREPIDRASLQRALDEIVARHEALRTTFTMAASLPVQRIAPTLEFPIEEFDLRNSEKEDGDAQRLISEHIAQPFDLQRGPLVRAALIRRRVDEALLVVVMHHIVSDGWSTSVFTRELLTLYAAFVEDQPSPLEPLGIQYADFAVWQREWLDAERRAHHVRYWREHLAGAPELLDLPCDGPRPLVERHVGAVQSFTVAPAVCHRLRTLARDQQATLFMVLLAVFKILLHRYTGQADIVVGSPIANRNRAELEPLIGFFVNMLALRTTVTESATIAGVIARVRDGALGGYEHQDLPFETLVAELQPPRSLSHSPIFQAAFVLQNTPGDTTAAFAELPEPGWHDVPVTAPSAAKFDLTVSLAERGDGLLGSIEYRTDLFGHRTIARLARRFRQLLALAADEPTRRVAQVPLRLPEEHAVSGMPSPLPTDAAMRLGLAVARWLGLDPASVVTTPTTLEPALAALLDLGIRASGAYHRPGDSPVDATHIVLTPAALSALSLDAVPPTAVLVVAGAPCFDSTLTRWRARQSSLVGLWAATANGVLAGAPLLFDTPEALLGLPFDGCGFALLDEDAQRQAIDLWGRLAIAGPPLMLAPDALAESRAWDAADPTTWFDTGLIARQRDDGALALAGRREAWLPLDGMRVDPGRLDALYRQHPAVQDVRIQLHGRPQSRTVTACLVPRAGRTLHPTDFVQYAAQHLPAGLVPRRIHVVETLEAGIEDDTENEAATLVTPPRTATEALLSRLWAEVLKKPQLDVHTNFFDAGGNSLTSVQVIARIRAAFHVELPLHRLFEAPTIAELAALIEADNAAALGLEEAELAADAPVDSSTEPAPQRVGRIRRAPPGPRRLKAPLSFAQERLWFLDQFQPGSARYNMMLTIPVDPATDPRLIRKVLTELTRRHEILRTTFPAVAGVPQQVVGPVVPVPMPVTDVAMRQPGDVESPFDRAVMDEVHKPFDLTRGPVLRARLIREGSLAAFVCVSVHHIVFDGWSFNLLAREFHHLRRNLADGRETALTDPPVQYLDFARWQRRAYANGAFEPHLQYWRRQLAGAPAALNLPTDRTRPTIETHRGRAQWFRCPPTVATAVGTLSRQLGTTPFCVLLAAFNSLLMRWSNQEDILIGTPVANRTRVEVEELVGFFANTLVLRTDLSLNPTFAELVGRVHAAHVAAVEHQELPFEKIVEELQPQRTLNQNPLFQVMFVLQNMPGVEDSLQSQADAWQQSALSGDTPLATPSWGTSKFDLTLTLIETASGLGGGVEYATDLFDDGTIARLIGQFLRILQDACVNPEHRIWQLPLMTDAEARALIAAGESWIAPGWHGSVLDAFDAQAALSPWAPAVIDGPRVVDYTTLHGRATRLAHRLAMAGVKRGDRVGLSMPRGVDVLVAVLGILKAGAAYVPIDPSYPAARRRFMLDDARVRLLIVDTDQQDTRATAGAEDYGHCPTLALGEDDDFAIALPSDPLPPLDASTPAYVIYTSGSTGRPKGVVMPHGPLANLIRWQIATTPPLLAGTRTLQYTSLSFDVSFQELFSTWSLGGALVVVGEEARRDPALLWSTMIEQQVDRLFLPYVALQQIAEHAPEHDPLPPLREVITAGEQLRITPAIVRLFDRLPACTLRNQYGPSETHVATEQVLAGAPASWPLLPSIGRPIANAGVRLLDQFLQPVPTGIPGEICLSGNCVALGYVERPEETARRFVPDMWAEPLSGRRMYRTGDLGRLMPDGAIEFLGRADHQVKIRGYRVEPGEIEQALQHVPEVAEAVVVPSDDGGGEKRLVAFLTPAAPNAAAEHIDFATMLKQRLPDYMVPAAFIWIDALPLTPSGKVDRATLARREIQWCTRKHDPEPPATPLESMLLAHWSELLRVRDADVNESFFTLGGHSLLATQVVSRIRQALGLQLRVRSVFEAPTVRQLAALIAREIAARVISSGNERLLDQLEERALTARCRTAHAASTA